MSKAHLLVSVIVPCFNHGRYLAEALDSIARQTYRNWECLIIDDGSSDNTADVASQFVKDDSRYRYFYQTNKGLSASRNVGLSIARGDAIQFLDSDDAILPDKFELQVAALRDSNSLTVAHCKYLVGRADCISEPDGFGLPATFKCRKAIYDLAFRWETELTIPSHCFLFDARIFRAHGIRFDESLRSYEDWECWMRVFALEPKSVFIDRELAVYRRFGAMTSNRVTMYAQAMAALSKQTRAWSHDAVMSRLLRLMKKRIDHVYKPCLRREGLVSAIRNRLAWAYARKVPWPLQKAFARIGETRRKPNAKLRNAISFREN